MVKRRIRRGISVINDPLMLGGPDPVFQLVVLFSFPSFLVLVEFASRDCGIATMARCMSTCCDDVCQRGFFAYHKPLVIPSLLLAVVEIVVSSACLALALEGGTKDCNLINGWNSDVAIACYLLVSPLVVSWFLFVNFLFFLRLEPSCTQSPSRWEPNVLAGHSTRPSSYGWSAVMCPANALTLVWSAGDRYVPVVSSPAIFRLFFVVVPRTLSQTKNRKLPLDLPFGSLCASLIALRHLFFQFSLVFHLPLGPVRQLFSFHIYHTRKEMLALWSYYVYRRTGHICEKLCRGKCARLLHKLSF